MKTALILEDNENITILLKMALNEIKCKLVTAHGEQKFFFKMRNQKFDLLIAGIEDIKANNGEFLDHLESFINVNKMETPLAVLASDLKECSPRLTLKEDCHILVAPYNKKEIHKLCESIFNPPLQVKKSNPEKVIKLPKGSILIREGSVDEKMYFLKEGKLGIYKQHPETKDDINLGVINPGEIVGEMSFIENLPRSASVKAVSDCLLFEIPNDRFNKVITKQPQWFKALVRTLCHRIREVNDKVKL